MRSFKAILVLPVSYCDFDGQVVVRPLGLAVTVHQLPSDAVSCSLDGQPLPETPGAYVATDGHVVFDIDKRQFQALN